MAATSNGDGESTSSWIDISFSNVSSEKILKLNDNVIYNLNNKIKIIWIESKSFVKAQKLLNGLLFENYPNAFVLYIKTDDEEENSIIKLCEIIDIKLSKPRPILLQYNSKNFYREQGKLIEIKCNLSDEQIQKNLKESIFNTEIFLNIQLKSKSQSKISEILKNVKNLSVDLEKYILMYFFNAIKSQDHFCVRLLKLFDKKLSQKENNKIFDAVVRSRNFNIFLAFIEAFEDTKVDIEDLQNLIDVEEAFLKAIECKNVHVFEFLLTRIKLEFSLLKNAIILSFAKDCFELFNILKGVEIKREYKDAFDELLEHGEANFDKIEQFRENIKNGNFENVKQFSSERENEKYKLCYGKGDVCVLELAIDYRQFEIFAFLRANGFYTDKESELDDKISRLAESQKSEIRLENLKYARDFPNAFIGILLNKCKFDACSPIAPSEVQKMLTDLSQIQDLNPFLEVAAQGDLKIIFDFATESVKNMIPECDEHTMGLVYFEEGKLYVGRDRNMLEMYGTFMHELTHMVLYMLYENSCLPYCKSDTKREEEWAKILKKEYENNSTRFGETEPIIRWVFQCYTEGYQQLAELAVRPNHIMARYFNDSDKVDQLKHTHASIFNFFQNCILPDLIIPNVFRLIKLNNDFEEIEKIKNFEFQPKKCINTEIINHTDKRLVLTSNVPKLALYKLYQEIKCSSQNKLDVKTKNIFIDVDKYHQIYFKNEVNILLEASTIERIIFDATDLKEVEKISDILMDEKFKGQFIIVCEKSLENRLINEYKFVKFSFDFDFENLTEESKQKIFEKKLDFQGNELKVSSFFEMISSKILPVLCSNKKVLINPNKNLKSDQNFIERILVRNNTETNINNFHISVQNEQFVVISDIAGSGKTTLLLKIGEILLKEHPMFWISFVPLRNFIKQLSENFFITFEESFCNILDLDPIEREIFNQKFAKGEAKILFDGFDEISPQCKDEALKLFKLFKKQDKNQIIATTRTHLKLDLEEKLEVESFKIKPLSDNDQVKFLCNFWKNSNANDKLIQRCAEHLTQKIAEMVKNRKNLIGIPIIIQSVAKLFVDKIDENFKSEVKKLKFSDIYRKILEECLSLLNRNNPTIVTKRLSPLLVFEYFAVVYFFGEKFAKDLGLVYDAEEWPIEEIARYGILTYEKDGEIRFNHLTYGEHLLSSYTATIFKSSKELQDTHIKLLLELLRNVKYEISQIFLDEMLESVDEKGLIILKSQDHLELFDLVAERKLPNLFRILINSNLMNLENFNVNEIIIKALLKIEDQLKFISFFTVVQQYFSEDLEKLFQHRNDKNETILHLTVKNIDIFKIVMQRMEDISNKDTLKEIIRVKNKDNQNVLMSATFQNERSFDRLLKFLKNLVDDLKATESEMKELLNEDDKDKNNILHLAARHLKSSQIFQYLCDEIYSKCIKNKKKFMTRKGESGNTLLHTACLNENGIEILKYIFDEMEACCNGIEVLIVKKTWKEKFLTAFDDSLDIEIDSEVKKLFFQNNKENQNFLCTAANYSTQSNLEFLIRKLFEIFDEREAKFILKKTKGLNDRNLLSLATQNKNKDSIEFLWSKFEDKFYHEEIVELLKEKDKNKDNFLHVAVHYSKSEEIFEFLWEKICKSFQNNERDLKTYLKLKGYKGQNILIQSIANKNENSFFHIFQDIYCKHLNFDDFIYETDRKGETFLHWLARYGTDRMIEYILKQLKEKLSRDKMNEFLMKLSKNKNNILHCIAESNQNINALKVLTKMMKEKDALSFEDFKKMLALDNSDGFYPLHFAIRYNTMENFQFFIKLYEDNLIPTDIKKILDRKDFIELATKNKNSTKIKGCIIEFYQKHVSIVANNR